MGKKYEQTFQLQSQIIKPLYLEVKLKVTDGNCSSLHRKTTTLVIRTDTKCKKNVNEHIKSIQNDRYE